MTSTSSSTFSSTSSAAGSAGSAGSAGAAGRSGRPKAPEPLFTAGFVRLGVADLAYFTAAGIAIYAVPPYVTGPLGSGEAGAGLAFGAFAVTALILRPFAGRLSDRHGRRPLLAGGALVGAVAMALTWFADSLPLVVALRLVFGIAEAAFVVASFAALADLAPPSRMGEALSYNSLGLYLGLTLGPPLGETLVERVGFAGAWCGAAVLLVAAAGVALGIGETAVRRAPGAAPASLVHWPAVPIALGFLTSIVAMGGFLAFVTLHARDVGLARTSLPLAVYGAVVVVCRITFARVPDRYPPLRLAAVALLTMAAGLSVVAIWAQPAGLLVGAAVLAVGITFSTPAFFSAIFATAAPSQRGAASGTAAAVLDVGLGGGPIALGLVAANLGIPWALGAAGGVAVLGSAWVLLLSRPADRGNRPRHSARRVARRAAPRAAPRTAPRAAPRTPRAEVLDAQ